MKYRNQEGFTLLELLISLSILSLLSMIIMNGIHTGVIGSQKISEKLNRIDLTQSFDRFFRKKITALLPIETSDEEGSRIYFVGSKNGIKFITQSQNGPQRYTITSYNENMIRFSAGVLQKTLNTYQIGPHHFSYFGTLAGDHKARWHQTWKRQPNTPKLVRLTINKSLPITVKPPRHFEAR
jgi:prepilin-type N-terminal cleavage/methylation domain-containing protein